MRRSARQPERPQLRDRYIGVGSAFVPNNSAVRRAVDILQMLLQESRENLPDRGVAHFHNLYTTYVVTMLVNGTAYRAVRDPFWLDSDIDLDLGIVGITDKGRQDFYNSRVVILPEVCRLQLEYYGRHRDDILAIAPLLDDRLHRKMSAVGHSQHPLRRDTYEKTRRDTLPLFFYMPLDPRRNRSGWIQVTPNRLRERLNKILPPPLNTNRHYLPSELYARGVPEDVILAHMGHWHHGLEPWGRYACSSMRAYRGVLQSHLNQIMRMDGWTALGGINE